MTHSTDPIKQALIEAFVQVTPKLAAAIKDLHGRGARKSEVKAYLKKRMKNAPVLHGSAMLYVDQLWSKRKAEQPPAPEAEAEAEEKF